MVETTFIRRRLAIVAALALLGIFIASYLLYKHYAIPTGEGICNISEKISCDVVNKSIYAEIFGIPVAGIGIAGYLIIFLLSLGIVRGWDFTKIAPRLRESFLIQFLLLCTGLGLLFTLYLTSMELFKLNAFCPFCVIQQAIILAIFVLLITVRYNIKRTV